MGIRPLGDRVLVEPLEVGEQRRGGVIIPDTAKERPQEGKVIAVGPGELMENGQRKQMEVKVGDRVLYGKYAGTEIKIEDKEYLILRESDILGIIE